MRFVYLYGKVSVWSSRVFRSRAPAAAAAALRHSPISHCAIYPAIDFRSRWLSGHTYTHIYTRAALLLLDFSLSLSFYLTLQYLSRFWTSLAHTVAAQLFYFIIVLYKGLERLRKTRLSLSIISLSLSFGLSRFFPSSVYFSPSRSANKFIVFPSSKPSCCSR